MDSYVLAFYLELGIGVIRPAFDISILSLCHIYFFGLLLNREIALIALFFLIYIRYPLDNENRSNLMFDSGLYDRLIENSTFVIYGIYDIR
jgi:hypothetical protein